MLSKSTDARIVQLADRLVALRYSGNGAVAGLFETPASGVHLARESVTVVAGKGFVGDHERKSFWRDAYVPGREVSACTAEVLELLGIDPAVVGDNLITRGIDLTALKPGHRIGLGNVILARSEREHLPCSTFRDRTSETAFRVASLGYRGALFVVARAGTIRVGESIQLLG